MSAERDAVVAAAEQGVAHAHEIAYTEGPLRDLFLSKPKGAFPFQTDCSGFVTWCYWMAGQIGALGIGDHVGYTGTLLEHGVQVETPEPGDLFIYGPGTGHHVAVYLYTWHGAWVEASHGDARGPVKVLQHPMQVSQPAPMRIRSYLPREVLV